jgi:hypothetical protein
MTTVTAQSPKVLRLVTQIAQMVSHGHHRATRSRTGGSIGTGHTTLVARSAVTAGGKHRAQVHA